MYKRKLLIVLTLCVLAAAVATGCATNIVTRKDVEDKYGDYIEVKYAIGEGSWLGRDSVDISFYYKPKEGGVYAIEPGTGALKDADARRLGYFIEGWYTDETYADKWDFGKRKATESTTLYARWLPNFNYAYYYVDEESGEEVKISQRDASPGATLSTTATPSREGYTFLGEFYSDPACTKKWDFDYKHPGKIENGEQVNLEVRVYTRWLEGNYTIVRSATDLTSAALGGNLYFLADVDFGELYEGTEIRKYEWEGWMVDFGGEIIGNGHKVSNIVIELSPMAPNMQIGRATDIGIFGSIKSGAKISDITFDNVTVIVEDTAVFERNIGILAGTVAKDVTLKSVEIENAKIQIQKLNTDMLDNYRFGLIAGDYEDDLSKLTENMLKYDATVDISAFEGYDYAIGEDGNEISITTK